MKAVFLTLLLLPSVAAAARPVAIEVRTAAPDPGAAQLIEAVARMARSDHGAALSTRMEAAREPSGGALDAAELARVRREVDAGVDAFQSGRLDDAVRVLGTVTARRDRLLGGDSKD